MLLSYVNEGKASNIFLSKTSSGFSPSSSDALWLYKIVLQVAHQLERAKPHPSEIEGIEEEDEEESISEDQIEQDIESAMEGVEMSWGGVEKHESKRLSFSTEDSFEAANVDVEAETTRESGGVDAQVSGLKALKGGDTKTATSSSTVDDQTSKLNELRQQRKQEQAAESDEGMLAELGLLDRLRALVGRNWSASHRFYYIYLPGSSVNISHSFIVWGQSCMVYGERPRRRHNEHPVGTAGW